MYLYSPIFSILFVLYLNLFSNCFKILFYFYFQRVAVLAEKRKPELGSGAWAWEGKKGRKDQGLPVDLNMSYICI